MDWSEPQIQYLPLKRLLFRRNGGCQTRECNQ